MLGQRLRAGFRRALLQADRGLWRIRLSGKPCGVLRAAGLCLVLVQDLLSGRLLRRDPQFAADGLLCPGPARARRARPWRRDPRGRRQSFRLGLRAGGGRASTRQRVARPPCRDARRDPTRHAVRLGFRQIKGLSEKRMRAIGGAARRRLSTRCAMSGCAPASMSDEIEKLAQADAFRSLGLDRRAGAMGGAGARRQERGRKTAAVRQAGHPPARQRAGNDAADHAARPACHP